jgi:hypothetical protein
MGRTEVGLGCPLRGLTPAVGQLGCSRRAVDDADGTSVPPPVLLEGTRSRGGSAQ